MAGFETNLVMEKSKTQVEAAYDVARTSTASVGKFDDKKKNEPKLRGGKRKFDAVVEERPKAGAKNADGTTARNEQQKNLALGSETASTISWG